MSKNLYAVYVADTKDWDREGLNNRKIFFGNQEIYIPLRYGGLEPIGHLVIIGYRAAIQKRNELNSGGDWTIIDCSDNKEKEEEEESRPIYAIQKITIGSLDDYFKAGMPDFL